jgi:hypothetical protein
MTDDGRMHGHRHGHASAATQAQWRVLRDAVVGELRAAGLPVMPSWNSVPDDEGRVGVLVDVNTAADIGGLQIGWVQPDEKLVPLVEAFEADTVTESMMRRYGQVTGVLTKAAALVLGIAGFSLRESQRPYSTLEYEVLHGPGFVGSDD